ncbi:phage portal protein [Myxococcus virescens]|nr:phage portal protein [Myxococcus virescens]SDD64942.1 phage portal protein, HK97 family [Myxococcus virescens]
MGRLGNAWRALFGPGDTAAQSAGGLLAGVLTTTQAPRRGTREVLQAYKRSPWVHSLFRRVAEDVASIPWQVYAAPGRRGKSVSRSLHGARGDVRARMVGRAVATGDLRPVDAHPFLDVLAACNPALGAHDTWTVAQLHLDLVGQAPLVWERNALGQPLELWPVAPHWIAEVPRVGFPYYRASWSGWQRNLPEADVLWLRGPDPEHPYARGTSYGEALGDEMDVGELRARYAKNFFYNDATPAALVSLEGASKDQLLAIKADWDADHRGPGRNGRPRFTGTKMQYQALTQSLKDMQLKEQREEDRDIVREVLGVPPEILGVLENSNRSTIDSAEYLYMRGVVVPRKERQRVALERVLRESYDERLVLGFVSPVPEDAAAQRAHMVSVPSAFTVNEHRTAGGRPALEDGAGEALYVPPSPGLGFGSLGLSAGKEDPAWARRAGGRGRPVRKAVDPVEVALEALRPEFLSEEVGPVNDEAYEAWAQQALDQLGTGARFDMRNPLVREALERAAGERIALINETTAQALRSELAAGAAAGEGVRELANRVEDVFEDAEGYRARRIARTEVVGLSNSANFEAWRQSDVVEGKEWLSVRDGSTRDSHRKLDGVVVGLDEPFVTSGGRKAQHPGGFGVAEEDINCRCTGLPKVADPDKAVRALTEEAKAALWKAFDEALVPWEDALEDALKRGFQAQKAAVLAAIGGES